jgi:non-ribosomal peptide synthetase component E (peptide arylation enzyme)
MTGEDDCCCYDSERDCCDFGSGEKMVLMYKWDPTQALQLIEREQVHLIVGVPTNTYDLEPWIQDFMTTDVS